jgi:hypothetical protein
MNNYIKQGTNAFISSCTTAFFFFIPLVPLPASLLSPTFHSHPFYLLATSSFLSLTLICVTSKEKFKFCLFCSSHFRIGGAIRAHTLNYTLLWKRHENIIQVINHKPSTMHYESIKIPSTDSLHKQDRICCSQKHLFRICTPQRPWDFFAADAKQTLQS